VDEEVVNPAEAATRSAFRRYKRHQSSVHYNPAPAV
jgi:hypothetical protein